MKPSGREPRLRQPKNDLSLLDRRKVLECLDAVRDAAPLSPITADAPAQKLLRIGRIAPATLLRALETERDPAVVGLADRTLERMADAGAPAGSLMENDL
ncbi:MAG TPA: hypothetical protein VFJ58_23560 [Armatimonadota bacterium]|nr:hypothetical protein [Armatimonadota bacterium]